VGEKILTNRRVEQQHESGKAAKVKRVLMRRLELRLSRKSNRPRVFNPVERQVIPWGHVSGTLIEFKKKGSKLDIRGEGGGQRKFRVQGQKDLLRKEKKEDQNDGEKLKPTAADLQGGTLGGAQERGGKTRGTLFRQAAHWETQGYQKRRALRKKEELKERPKKEEKESRIKRRITKDSAGQCENLLRVSVGGRDFLNSENFFRRKNPFNPANP